MRVLLVASIEVAACVVRANRLRAERLLGLLVNLRPLSRRILDDSENAEFIASRMLELK